MMVLVIHSYVHRFVTHVYLGIDRGGSCRIRSARGNQTSLDGKDIFASFSSSLYNCRQPCSAWVSHWWKQVEYRYYLNLGSSKLTRGFPGLCRSQDIWHVVAWLVPGGSVSICGGWEKEYFPNLPRFSWYGKWMGMPDCGRSDSHMQRRGGCGHAWTSVKKPIAGALVGGTRLMEPLRTLAALGTLKT